MKTLLCIATAALGLAIAFADETKTSTSVVEKRHAVATSVYDGDSVTLRFEGEDAKIKTRLYGIDAPEQQQDYGKTASARLRELINQKPLEVVVKGLDNKKRPLVVIYCNGKDINLEMIREGMAWHYDRYDNTPEYEATHKEAKEHKRGLWINDDAIHPETFRHPK